MIRVMTQAAGTQPLTVFCASMALPEAAEGSVPDWVQLTPTLQGEIATFDGRGPFQIKDAAAVIAASMALPRGILIDENHATDHAAPIGHEAPARGWIKEMEARPDGIWGRVEWTKAGRELVADKAYRGISPAMTLHPDKKTLRLIPRASLVNLPNLRGMTALHMESSMDPMAKVAEALGLAGGASEGDILTAIKALKDKKPEEAKGGDLPALQSAMKDIGTALGVEGDTAVVLAAAKLAGAGKDSLVALQSQLTTLQTELATLKTADARAKSEMYVRGEIAEGRLIPANAVDDLITLHMSQPELAVKMVEGAVMGKATHTTGTPPAHAGAEITALNSEQIAVADQLGIKHETYLADLKADMKKGER